MNKKERLLIKEIYKDCLKLKRQGDLSESGYGQMMLCKLLLQGKHSKKQDYKKYFDFLDSMPSGAFSANHKANAMLLQMKFKMSLPEAMRVYKKWLKN